MESKKLEKPRKSGAFSIRQAVMKSDEEIGGVFPTMKPLDWAHPAEDAVPGNVPLRTDLRRAANGGVDAAGHLPRRKEGEYAAGRRTPPSAVKAKTAGRKT